LPRSILGAKADEIGWIIVDFLNHEEESEDMAERFITNEEAAKIQRVIGAKGFSKHTCGYQPGCLCTEMYPGRIKRLLITRTACEEKLEAVSRVLDTNDDADFWSVLRSIAPFLAELHGEKS
jgi:hypothetical protein